MTAVRYAAKKLFTLLLTMVVVSFLTFAAFDLISGDPASAMLGTQATQESLDALREEMGLNRPLPVRYGEWLAGFFTGNLGTSTQYRQPVQDLLASKTAVTLCLSLVSFALILAVSLPLGLLSSRRPVGWHPYLFQPALYGRSTVFHGNSHLLALWHPVPALCPRGFPGAAGERRENPWSIFSSRRSPSPSPGWP